ncbi:MAG: S8 family serine peptidase, partial [Candidatus Pacebacteria bacterium]|nr:S8 family serine peptidase [Candidatus Paceibacterota bacterium]
AAEEADVLSLSLGGGNYDGHCDSDPLAAKVNWAVDQGLVVTVSSGNDGKGVSSPACASGVIAVGAVDKLDVRPYWSNYGLALDLVAPGVDILSTYSCVAAGDCGAYWYAWMSGTSMSAPHVAGTVALILQKNPDYTVDDVKEALYETAINLGGDTGWDEFYGHGMVDVFSAVNYIVSEKPECAVDSDCNDGEICCGEICSSASCSINTDCDDDNACTVNTCDFPETCSAFCSYAEITSCTDDDDCCPEGCTNDSDSDCSIEDPCLNCFKGVCDGKCNPSKEGTDCPDCQS